MERSDVDITLQWGHDVEVVEDVCEVVAGRLASAGFNGATTLKSWKIESARRPRDDRWNSFNGATTLKSWKIECDPRDDARHDLASMGPRR